MSDTVETLIAYCREKNRVCPQPRLWHQMWEMLPDRRQVGSGWQPPLPLILAAWDTTPALSKMLRLAEHIEWAEKHNTLDAVSSFLRALPEDDWHHSN